MDRVLKGIGLFLRSSQENVGVSLEKEPRHGLLLHGPKILDAP